MVIGPFLVSELLQFELPIIGSSRMLQDACGGTTGGGGEADRSLLSYLNHASGESLASVVVPVATALSPFFPKSVKTTHTRTVVLLTRLNTVAVDQ